MDEGSVRVFAPAIKDNLLAVSRYIKTPDPETGIEIGQLALRAGPQINQPEIL